MKRIPILAIASFIALPCVADEDVLIETPSFRCATCEYVRKQNERIRKGLKPIVDTRFVPEDFWSPQKVGHEPMDAYNWPTHYYPVKNNRTDSDGDGLRECRIRIDFSRFANESQPPAEPEAWIL